MTSNYYVICVVYVQFSVESVVVMYSTCTCTVRVHAHVSRILHVCNQIVVYMYRCGMCH